jgi:hypothetical protein
MDNSANTNENNDSSGTSLCEILMVVFIAFLAYYILYDGAVFREGFSSAEAPSSGEIIKMPRKVSFENKASSFTNGMPEDIGPEYMPGLSNGDHPLLNDGEDDEEKEIKTIKRKKKSRKNKKHAGVNPSDLTGGDRSLLLMNENAKQNSRGYSCNLLGLNSNDMDEFKRNYYGMYAHQIECPKNCHMNKLGMKKCDLQSDKDCNGVFTTNYNNPDVYALNYMALLNNNERPCVTCTEKPSIDDRKRLDQMKVTNANLSNTVNFEDNVYLNSIGETQVDKMAEIRTGCATGTCGLKDYGKSIKNVYDNLLNTPVYNNRKSCDPYQLTGINENTQLGDNYASYN